MPDELKPISGKLLAGASLSPAEERLLRRKYLHRSAHWKVALLSDHVAPDVFFGMRPTDDGKRVVHPNAPP